MPTAVFQIFSHNSLDLQQLQHLSLTCSGCVDVYLNPYRRCSKTRVVIVNFSHPVKIVCNLSSSVSVLSSASQTDDRKLLFVDFVQYLPGFFHCAKSLKHINNKKNPNSK